MNHRHLDLPPGTPAQALPVAALHDLLDRGDLDDWLPLLRSIDDDPHGVVGSRVARLVDCYPMYGTSPLLRAWIERCRARVQRPPRHPGPPLSLARVRLGLGKTQAELAARMGISQSDYSKLERRGDMRLSTLAVLARALGGRLRLVLSFRDRDQEIKIGSHPRGRQPAERVRLVPKEGTRSTR